MQTKWRAPGIVLSGTETLTLFGDVTIVLTAGSGTQAISVTGSAGIYLAPLSSLTVYVEGDVKIAGRGLANFNTQPVSCQLWDTNTSVAGQEIEVLGNGALKSVIYTLVGNAAFHYDESLATRDSNEPFAIAKWREVTSATDLARYSPLFDGW